MREEHRKGALRSPSLQAARARLTHLRPCAHAETRARYHVRPTDVFRTCSHHAFRPSSWSYSLYGAFADHFWTISESPSELGSVTQYLDVLELSTYANASHHVWPTDRRLYNYHIHLSYIPVMHTMCGPQIDLRHFLSWMHAVYSAQTARNSLPAYFSKGAERAVREDG